MSLQIKIRVEENKDSLYLFDETGKYNEKCNKTGWGNPNAKISTAIHAEFNIYPPKSTVPIIINVFPDFPNDDSVGYEIIPADLSMDEFDSGVWRFDYFVRTFDSQGETLHSSSCQKLLTLDVECCLAKGAIKVNVENFETKEVAKSTGLNNLLLSAKDSACVGNTKEAQKIIDHLYAKCKCNC